MKVSEVKRIAEERLALLKERFTTEGVIATQEVELARYEAIGTEPSDRLVVSLAISLEGDEDRVLYLSEDLGALKGEDEIDDECLKNLEVFENECSEYAVRLNETKDKAATVDKINEELYGKLLLEAENGEKQINKSLRSALMAVGLVALCAIVTLVIELLLK